jgi:creatinine amidohydrolase
MRLEDLNWMDVEAYVQHEDRLMLVLGACEQHGYLSLTTDTRIPLALADAAGERTGVIVAPPIPFGVSPSFTSYPGTISLPLRTFLGVVEEVVRGLHRQGFRRLVVINGHGGNDPARGLLSEMVNELPGLRVSWYSWWQAPHVLAVAWEHGLQSHHGGAFEAFSFTRVAPLPPGEKPTAEPQEILSAPDARRLYGDGVTGGPYHAEPEVMDALFTAAVEDIVAGLEHLKGRAPG